MLDDDKNKPLDPKMRARAQARLDASRARHAAMTEEERRAYDDEQDVRLQALVIELEDANDCSSPSPAVPAFSRRDPSPDLRTAIREVLREEPELLRATVREVLREMAEEHKRNG